MMRTPSLRRHKPSGRAVVTLGGHDHYLGRWPANKPEPSQEVKEAYGRLIAEWLAAGSHSPIAAADITIVELVTRYLAHVKRNYRRPDGSEGREVEDITRSLRPLNHLYGRERVKDFGPLRLKAVRQLMIDGYTHPKYGEQPPLARTLINQRVGRIRRLFKWAVAEQL